MRSETPFEPDSVMPFVLVLLILLLGVPCFPAHAGIMARDVSVQAERNLVVFFTYGDGIPVYQQFTHGFLSVMEERAFPISNLFLEYLDLERANDQPHRTNVASLLRHKYDDRIIDLVVTMHGGALRLLRGEASDVFQGSPLLSVFGPSSIDPPGLERNFLLMPITMDFSGTIDLVLTLFPRAKRLVVVSGVGEGEQRVLRDAADVFDHWSDRLRIEFTDELNVEEMLRHVADLPEHSIVLYYNVFKDRTGRNFVPRDVARMVVQAANAPVFGMYSTVIENGVIGGSVMHFEEVGRQAGEVALDVLKKRMRLTEPVTILPASRVPLVDWQALQAWEVQDVQLPLNTLIVNRPMSLWEQYRKFFVLVAMVVLGQALLIALFFMQTVRRRSAEQSLKTRLEFEQLLSDISAQFVDLPADRIDDKIQETQRRVCELLGLDLSSLWQSASLGDPLSSRMTHVYRKHDDPPMLENMDATYFPFSLKLVMAGKVAVVQVRDLPREVDSDAAQDLKFYEYFGIKSSLIFPLLVEKQRLDGILSFATVNREFAWPPSMVDQLSLLAQVYVGALARKNAEMALRDSEARLSLTTNAAQAGLWILDLDTGEYWVSEITRKIFQFAPNVSVTIDLVLGMVHPDDRELVRQTVLTASTRGELARCEYRVRLPDGSTRWIGSFGQRDTGPRPSRLMGVSIDLTERVEAENRLRLQWEQLAHATRVGTMGELTSALAHEINQPLTAIRSNAEAAQRFLARSEPDLDEVRLILEDVIQDSSRAGNVIRKIREMLRKESTPPTTLDVNKVIRDVLQLMRSDSLTRGTRFSFDLASEPPLVLADPVQLQQVLINLILNGAAAMRGAPEDQRGLVVKTAIHEGRSVHVEVTDRGHGFDQSMNGKLFEPFYTTKPDGMGLGLSISKTIIEAHGGTITAMNNPEGGSTFSFSLPIAGQGEQ